MTPSESRTLHQQELKIPMQIKQKRIIIKHVYENDRELQSGNEKIS